MVNGLGPAKTDFGVSEQILKEEYTRRSCLEVSKRIWNGDRAARRRRWRIGKVRQLRNV
jgi:hypothetical protein